MSFIAGKVALVTGGGSGIGLAISEALLKNDARGVLIVDICEPNHLFSALLSNFKDKVLYVKADVSKADQFEDAFKRAISHFKNLDIVINNAGTEDERQWEKMVDVNLGAVIRGTFLAFEKYLPKYRTSDDAVIVNIASTAGINLSKGLTVYTATKHGVVGLGVNMNQDHVYENSRIRILTVCPGVVQTPMIARLVNDGLYPGVLKISEKISSVEYIGESVTALINNGKRGMWVLENEEDPYEVIIPFRKDLKVSTKS